jgi:phosphotransferase system enzyme I (PtsP)
MIKMSRRDNHHLNFLCDVSELVALLAGSENIENFLQRTVEMVAVHMNAGECSLYLLDEKSVELTLRASTPLNSEAVGKKSLKIGEGLIGKALEQLMPINEGFASLNPRYSFRGEPCEDYFGSFLAVPVHRGNEKIGVLVVQQQAQYYFNETDVMTMRAIASQLAGAVGNARLLIGDPVQASRTPEAHGLLMGQVASHGCALAPATVIDKDNSLLDSSETETDSKYDLIDFHRAVQDTTKQLQEVQSRLAQRLAESASLIFTAHLMILKDLRFTRRIENLIKSGTPVPTAVKEDARHYIDLFGSSSFGHIQDKTNDVKDLAMRLLKNLMSRVRHFPIFGKNRIVVASELYPSEILRLASEDVQGIVLVSGGVTSHVAIIARSLQIPLIIVNRPELLQLSEGTPLIIDGEGGIVHINPSEEVIRQFRSQKKTLKDADRLAHKMSPVTFTGDGVHIHLLANINLLSDLRLAREMQAEGIGLFRSEFPFFIRSAAPSEEEQFLVYKRLFDEMPGKPVTIRTLDTGSDKLLAYSDTTVEANPALGLRSMRFLFRHREIFHQQLRAILRAAVGAAKPQIMFPMVSSLDDFQAARQVVYDCMALLERDNLAYHGKPAIGALIEIPSVLEVIDAIAGEADFLSIGTNDFIQYMLAVDRTNPNVAEYYQPYQPAVLRALAKIVKRATYFNREVSVCGELAHDSKYIPFLLGIGIRILSVYPKLMPAVQKTVSSLKLSDAKLFAERLLDAETHKGAQEVLRLTTEIVDHQTKGR